MPVEAANAVVYNRDGENAELLSSGKLVGDSSKPPLDAAKKPIRRSLPYKLAFYSCLMGFLFILLTIISVLVMKFVVEQQILRNLPLIEGSDVLKFWMSPPVTPILFLRIFNLTNHEAFLKGLEKPRLSEIGPYAYSQIIEKVDLNFSADALHLSHRTMKHYRFSPELSQGSENDYVLVPNVPMFGGFEKLKSESTYTKSFFKSLLKSYDFGRDTSTPFLRLKVKEFLWGYPSVLISLGRTQLPECQKQIKHHDEDDEWHQFFQEDGPEDVKKSEDRGTKIDCEIREDNLEHFGLFLNFNGTRRSLCSVNTGLQKVEDRGLMVDWENQPQLNYWKLPECNMINSSRDPSLLPFPIHKTDILSIFIGQLCRTIQFKYVKEYDSEEGFKTMRFTPLESTFDSPSDSPENECYCIQEPCLPSGLLDIRGCQPSSPIFMSWPHFLYADPDLRRRVDGLSPDPQKHSFILDVSPKYGSTLTALARLQMNVIIERNSGFGYFDNINQERIVYPFGWVEEGVLGPSELVISKLQFLLNLPANVQFLVAVIGLGISLLMLTPEIIIWARNCI